MEERENDWKLVLDSYLHLLAKQLKLQSAVESALTVWRLVVGPPHCLRAFLHSLSAPHRKCVHEPPLVENEIIGIAIIALRAIVGCAAS